MRRKLAAGLLTLALGGASGCAGAPRYRAAPLATTAPAQGSGGLPTWLPQYTPQQLALLAPVDRAIQVPAPRVFPDLQRFWYANNRPLANVEDALKFTRMVATILNDSPRFYTLDEAPPELSNPIVQYGPLPPDEPDGFQITKRGADGMGELTPAPLSAEAKGAFEKGKTLSQKGDADGALTAYRAAISKSPRVPALRVALADALFKAGKVNEAEAAYKEAVAADPTFALAHFGLALIAEKRSDLAATRSAIAEALAYQPNSRRALEIAARIGGGSGRIAPYAIFLDVDSVGAIRAAAPGGTPAQMYAGCRAIMRYEPDIRAQIFDEPAETPYYLSVVEEVICLEAALGAYLVEQRENADGASDPKLDDLLTLARRDGLSGYVMFEILGMHRPERARVAPQEVHRAVVRYIDQRVLGQKDVPDGVYNASAGWGAKEARVARSADSGGSGHPQD
jgi:tetratricopeptide (TPR) repeat protein